MSKKIIEDVKIDKWEVYSKIDVRRNYNLIFDKNICMCNIFLYGLRIYLTSSNRINSISSYNLYALLFAGILNRRFC